MSGGLASEGNLGRLFVREASTDPFKPVRGILSLARNGTQGEAECTNFDSEGKGEYLQGITNATYAVRLNNYRGRDPGQEVVVSSIGTKKRFQYRYYPLYSPASGEEYFEGLGFATADDRTHELENATELSLTLRGSGDTRKKQSGTADEI